MGMVAPDRRIGSAFFVSFGEYGDVSRFAEQHGISRQWVYQEARQVSATLDGARPKQVMEDLRAENKLLRQQMKELEDRLKVAVLLSDEKQAEFATVGQACGVTLSQSVTLLNVLIPTKPLSRTTLGRRTHAMGQKAGPLLEVLDEYTHPRVRDAAADEIYVSDPVLMMVEQESLCWTCGRLSEEVSGKAWSDEFDRLPNLEQVARDGGTGLAKGVGLTNAKRLENKQKPFVDQGDHYHGARHGGVALRRAEKRAQKALNAAEVAQKALEECARQGQAKTGPTSRARQAWQKAEQAMDAWRDIEQAWEQTKGALRLITPEGELNTRAQAQAVLAQTLQQLPDSDFAKTKRCLQQPEMLNYLDRVEEQLKQLQIPTEIKDAAVRQEALRRRPELLRGETPSAAALRGVMLMCAVVLAKAEEVGQQATTSVREIFRRAYRASSLVECINSVLRMQQAQHRKMSQGLLDLKRLYWNCHTFRTGHRRNTTPYERLGVHLPDGIPWWEMLKLTPEQLRAKLSTINTPP